MTEQEYRQAGELFNKIRQKRAELEQVEHLISNIEGATAKVKINSSWIVELPVVALRGHAQTRKVQLEQEINDFESQLNLI